MQSRVQTLAVLRAWQPAWADGAAARFHAWREAEAGRFVPWLAVLMGAGVLGYFALRTEPGWWAGPLALGLSAAGCVAAWRAALPRAAALCALAASVGFTSAQVATWRALPIEALPTRAVILTATVAAVEELPAGVRVMLSDVVVAADAPPLRRRVRVRLRANDPARPQVGDSIRLRALLRPPSPPAYPGGWDLQRDAWFSGLAGYGTALGKLEIVGQAAPPGRIGAWWAGLRATVAGRVRAALPGAAGGVAVALLTGSTAAMGAEDRAAFRDSGLAHLLAVAGLHIGAVMALVLGLTRLGLASWEHAALHWPTKAIAAVTALLAGAGYAALSGGHVPVLRSFAMACLVTLAIIAGRRALSLRGLALAACVLMLAAPQEVPGVSFQMSFSAVLALIAGYEALRPALAWFRGRWPRRMSGHVAALALTSLLAGTASAPFAAYHFGHVQLYNVAANLVAVPICAMWALPCGLLALGLMPFGLDGLALAPMGWGLEAILWIARGVSAWPGATVAVPHIPAWGLALVGLGLAWLGLWRSRLRWAGVVPVAAGLAAAVLARAPDLLVSADARLIGVRAGHDVLLQSKSGTNAFVRDAWLAYWGNDRWQALGTPTPPGTDLLCGTALCRLQRANQAALVLRGAAASPVDCAGVELVVAPEPARDACPGRVRLVDRFTVWRDGAHAIWLTEDGPVILSDRADRGSRPWVPPLPTPRRPVLDLPMAETDPGGAPPAVSNPVSSAAAARPTVPGP